MPSPPPEYNFAEIPLVKSRYPLVEHERGRKADVHETTTEEEAGIRIPTAKELHITMPNPSIWPLIARRRHRDGCSAACSSWKSSVTMAIGVMLTGTAVWVGSLYKWLTTPLEDAH